MQAHTITLTGNGTGTKNSTPHVMDYRAQQFKVGLGFSTDGSTTGFTVQHTFDDPWATYATDFNTNAVWYDHDTMAAMTANDDGNYDFPVTAIRLQSDANGTDTGTLRILSIT